MKKALLIVGIVGLFGVSCTLETLGQTKKAKLESYHGRSIVFYNVENLFDTIDQAEVIDEEFLPNGKNKWNSVRYQTKLAHIVEAVTLNLTENPLFIGMVEVENAAVVRDVAKTGRFAKTNYQLAHKDSPDARGIDCALLYDADRFTLVKMEALTVKIDSIPDFKTRDILYVQGKLAGNKTVHLFVNHWPSRRGGETESEFKRCYAAQVARNKVNEILKANPKANIIMMGDFNDHPTDMSIEKILAAKQTTEAKADLINLMYDDQVAGKGTHNYQNKWGVLDQFIISSTMFKGKGGLKLATGDAVIVFEDILLYKQKDGSKAPSKTYGGSTYFGGYSDHLPIQLKLK